jgi:pimeloyl-ACP methyl ester carboxylesterase
MPTLQARGVEVAWRERGEGPPVLLVHETAAAGAIWDRLMVALAEGTRPIAYDRRGWGESGAPEGYRRTTVEEQSEDAAALLEAAAEAPAVIAGAGLGGVIALDLLLRRPDLVAGGLLIEPPLLQLLPHATEELSDDRRRLEAVVGGADDLVELYLSGALPALGPGVSRLPAPMAAAARERPASVLAELGIAAGWRMPLPRLAGAERKSVIVTSESTPQLLRDAAAVLDERLAGATAHEATSGYELPHLGATAELGGLIRELSR